MKRRIFFLVFGLFILITASCSKIISLGPDGNDSALEQSKVAGTITFKGVFQANTGELWSFTSDGYGSKMGLGMMDKTSPSIAALSTGGYQTAFQANTNQLWVVGEADWKNTGLGMRGQGTSPSIAGSSKGGYMVAMQANTSSLWTYSSTSGAHNWSLGMMNKTSPSIASISTGGYQIAFQSNVGQLWVAGDAGTVNTGLGMRGEGTSPSIAASPKGGYMVAMQANTSSLWTYSPNLGTHNWQLGLKAGTSPSICALANGGYQIAFQSNAGQLWVVGDAGWVNTGLGMMEGTSPSIRALPDGGYQVTMQANTTSMWTYSPSLGTHNWQLGLKLGTSPSIASPGNGTLATGYSVTIPFHKYTVYNGINYGGIVIKTPTQGIANGIAAGFNYLGWQYVWGGGDASGPTLGIHDWGIADYYGDYNRIGFDCAGLTQYVAARYPANIPGYSYAQRMDAPKKISWDQALPGDLVGYNGHITIFLGVIGGKRMQLESPQSGDFIKVSTVRSDADSVVYRWW